jgi:hypothetical protein
MTPQYIRMQTCMDVRASTGRSGTIRFLQTLCVLIEPPYKRCSAHLLDGIFVSRMQT